MAVLVLDPNLESWIKAERQTHHPDSRDEVWDGVLVMPPLPNNEHQQVVMDLCYAFRSVVGPGGIAGHVLPGANVSDRDQDWVKNYRDPDAVVYLAGNPAVNRNTHWVGGPDLLVEVVSPGEDPRAKFGFYASVNTREVLIVERDPWAVELFRLDTDMFRSVGRSDLSNPAVMVSGVLPLSFQIRDGSPRPTILITHTTTGQTWVV